MTKDKLAFSTRAIHTSLSTARVPSTPIATPIHQTASFSFDDTDQIADAIHDHGSSFVYSRLSNPTVDTLERAVADLEGAEAGVAFASGMAAIHGALIGLCKSGDHIVAPASMYGGSFELMTNVLPRFGIETTFVENGDLDAVVDALRPATKVIYTETISNPALTIADIDALAEISTAARTKLVVDNTFASPALCRPIERGADLVVHSASKYLGGHGDLIGGIVLGAEDDVRAMQKLTVEIGGAMAPFVAWLVLRGLKTLSLRVRQHATSAMELARFLEAHPAVKNVRYPGLPSHPDHTLARRYLTGGFGGMIAFEVDGTLERGRRFMNALEIIKRAGSLGDAHSLALQPATTSHRQLGPEGRKKAGISDGFVRLSVGLEDPADLQQDLARALGVPA